jgi:hypothetical protein
MVPKPGPHIAMAVFCERVLDEKDGVLSVIRIVDRFTITVRGPGVPSEMPAGQINVTLVVGLRSGNAKGRHSLSIWPELPSGERATKTEMPVFFEGEERGVNAVLQIVMPITQEGLYWFDLILDENQYLTRVPLRIVYQPIQASATPPGLPPKPSRPSQ